MRKLLFLILVLLAGCHRPEMIAKTEYLKLADSITALQQQNKTCIIRIQTLQDSIAEFKQHPLMTSDQFLQLYKYERLYKYYRICKKNPSQWKYYKGWSIRVFEQ